MNNTEKKLSRILNSSATKKSYTRAEQTIHNIHNIPIAPPTPGLLMTFIRLIRFISWKIWFVQGICLIILCRVLVGISNLDQGISPGITIRIICLICGSIPFISIPLLYRSVQYRMLEIEMATYHSFSTQMLSKLLTIAIGDLCMLTSGIIISIHAMHLNLLSSVIYWMTPFLLFTTLILLILTHISANRALTFYGCSYLGLVIFAEVFSQIHAMIETGMGAYIMLITCSFFCISIVLQTKKIIGNPYINELNLSESY